MATSCLTARVSLVSEQTRGQNSGLHNTTQYNTKENSAQDDPKIHLSARAEQTVWSPFNLEVTSLWSLHKVHLSVMETPAFYSVLQYLNPLIK